jgi:1-acyl-sn-glycerol-3-phosphate acyltransferase
MWLTILICLDVFLLWLITGGICSIGLYFCVRICGMPPSLFELPFFLMSYAQIPNGFIVLARFTPNLILVGIYFMYSLPKSQSFKCWWGWEWLRRCYFGLTEPSKPNNLRKSGESESPSKLVDSDSPPKIFAVSPHGCYGESVIIGFTLNPQFKSVTTISTSLLFWIPIVREFAYLAGCVPANSHNISHELSLGNSIVLIPEGLRGTLHPSHKVLRGIPGECEPRIGFIRCAMMHKQYVIVPVYCHGIDKLYTTYNIFPWLQKQFLKTYYYPWPMINFGWWGSFWPKRGEGLRYVFGKEIHLVNQETGELRDIMEIHAEYCDAIKKLSKV